MAKTAARGSLSRKPKTKKADAPTTGTAKKAQTATRVKSVKKTATPLKKTKRKSVLSVAALKRIENIKGKANGLMLCIKQDVQAAVNGEVSPVRVQRMLKDMMDIAVEASENMYRDPK